MVIARKERQTAGVIRANQHQHGKVHLDEKEEEKKKKKKTLPDFQKRSAALCGDINRGDKDNCS